MTQPPDEVARRSAEAMWAGDAASRGLGMELVAVGPGRATLRMTVREDMVNGHAIGHGGFTFTLADSAFAFACNSYNRSTVAAACEIRFLAPTRLGDVLRRRGRGAQPRGPRRRLRRHGPRRRHRGRGVRRPQQGDPRARCLEPTERWSDRLDRPRVRCRRTTSRSCARCSSSGCARRCARAYDHVPHYRRAFDDAGVLPPTCTSLADLARFPFTTKEDLRQNYPFGMFAVPREQVSRVHASSGTTGKPTVVGYTAEDIDTWAEVMARSIRAAGGRPGDIVHVAYGYGLFTGGLGAHYGAERLGCTVVPVSGGMTPRQVQLIVDFEPRVIMVTPSYFLGDPRRDGGARAIDPRTTSLEIGIFGAEPWTDEMRHEVERRSGIKAVDIYGLSEVMGPGVSQEAVGDQGRAARLGGPLLPRDHRPGHRRGAARRRGGRAGLHLADQAGDAGDPLPHPRPDPAAARHGVPGLPADAEGHRPHRRHDDRARRQRLPDAGRGADPQGRGADPALPLRADPARQPRRARPSRSRRTSRSPRPTARPLGRRLAEHVKDNVGTTVRVEHLDLDGGADVVLDVLRPAGARAPRGRPRRPTRAPRRWTVSSSRLPGRVSTHW